MGICSSSSSSAIHEAEDFHENVVCYKETSGSVCSHEGSKGLNQDAGVMYQGYGIYDGVFGGVFDGHGQNGHIVSQMVRNRLPPLLLNRRNSLSKITSSIEERPEGETEPNKNFYKWKKACVTAFTDMDNEIRRVENLDCSCSGTTAVVVIKQGEDLVIANLGDSRAVLGTSTEDGVLKAVQLTTDLKPDLAAEADRIRKCNGRVIALKEEPHIQRVWLPNEDSPGLAMSRAFGDFVLKNHGIIATPEVSYRRLTPNDQFLVSAPVGVWDVLNNDEVMSAVAVADGEEAAAKAVVDAALAAWERKFPKSRRDDCTAACIFLQKMQKQVFPETT